MKYQLTTFLLALGFMSFGQELRPFRVELGLSFNSSTDENFDNGMGFYIEPRYAANDNWLFGFRLEKSFVNGNEIEVPEGTFELSITHVTNNFLFTEYFFSEGRVRPFVGLGAGIVSRKKVGLGVDIGGVEIGELDNAVSNFGFAPRAGVNSGRWRFLAVYNVTGKDIADYLALNVGFEIGRKDKSNKD